ncbi:12946_t:CDS:2, partial [Funneliformis geosporum]
MIIDICDGLRPPTGDIVAPEGYIELMKECWDSDPNKRPATGNIYNIDRWSGIALPLVEASISVDI